jgi:phosphatidylethanolamine-binding protein (PEBP) family uncharacterized protein
MCVLVACGTSGRDLRDPAPGATAPPRKGAVTTSTTGNQVSSDPNSAVIRPTGFALSAVDWSPDGAIPASYGCAGGDVAPSLSISGVPAGTSELLLVATDVAKPTEYRWIIAAIAPTTVAITPDSLPSGAVEVSNSTGSVAWAGPCPTQGSTMTFQLRLYALSAPSGLSAAAGPAGVLDVLPNATQAAVLRGVYTR